MRLLAPGSQAGRSPGILTRARLPKVSAEGGGRIGILVASAGRYPDFNLEAVDLEALARMRKHQDGEKFLSLLRELLSASEQKDGGEGVAMIHPDLHICPVFFLHDSHKDSQKSFPTYK